MSSHERPAMLLAFHCRSNTGYAIGRLEKAFLEMARRVIGDDRRIHYSYKSLDGGHPAGLPAEIGVLAFDPFSGQADRDPAIAEYIRRHDIQLCMGFDFPVNAPAYRAMHHAGLRAFVSYWGAPMSSQNRGLKLLAKRIEVALHRHKPDLFVFESEAMRRLATAGRGIRVGRTDVCPTGVDADRFVPLPPDRTDAHDAFSIPRTRRVILYSGHMEERKGVAVLVRAVAELVIRRQRRDVHLVVLGNRGNEADPFLPIYAGTAAADHITFGGYREDIDSIMGSSYLGVIPSTGWDSFPMSALEMASAGLPLIGSRLHGIPETMDEGRTGLLFPPGDHLVLADQITSLVDDPDRRDSFSRAARNRILTGFTVRHQVERLSSIVRRVAISRGISPVD